MEDKTPQQEQEFHFNIDDHYVERDGASGYSVKSLAAAGLYSTDSSATRAIESSGLNYELIELPFHERGGARPYDRLIQNRVDALSFVTSARTPFGRKVKGSIKEQINSWDGYTTIDWSMLLKKTEQGTGISLRKIVTIGGVYDRYRDAKAAFDSHEVNSSLKSYAQKLVVTPSFSTDGLEDILFQDPRDAQLFCVRANTPGGARIAEIILHHHNDFQKLLEGTDEEAEEVREKVNEHREGKARAEAAGEAPEEKKLDPVQQAFLHMFNAYQESQQQVIDMANRNIALLEGKSEKLEDMVKRYQQIRPNMKQEDEMTALEIAAGLGWKSGSGKDHALAVNAAFDLMGAKEGEHYRLIWDNNQASENGNGMYRYRVYPKGIARELCKSVYPTVNPNLLKEFSFEGPNKKSCHVKLADNAWIPRDSRKGGVN